MFPKCDPRPDRVIFLKGPNLQPTEERFATMFCQFLQLPFEFPAVHDIVPVVAIVPCCLQSSANKDRQASYTPTRKPPKAKICKGFFVLWSICCQMLPAFWTRSLAKSPINRMTQIIHQVRFSNKYQPITRRNNSATRPLSSATATMFYYFFDLIQIYI